MPTYEKSQVMNLLNSTEKQLTAELLEGFPQLNCEYESEAHCELA